MTAPQNNNTMWPSTTGWGNAHPWGSPSSSYWENTRPWGSPSSSYWENTPPWGSPASSYWGNTPPWGSPASSYWGNPSNLWKSSSLWESSRRSEGISVRVPKKFELNWKLVILTGIALSCLLCLGIFLKSAARDYRLRRAIDNAAEPKRGNMKNPIVWNDTQIISDELSLSNQAVDYLNELAIKESVYKVIFIKRSASSTTDPMFSDDGCWPAWKNDQHLKGHQIAIILWPIDRARSRIIHQTSPSSLGAVGRHKELPKDFHYKELYFEDTAGWFWYRFNQRAVECFTTYKHNINISKS